MVLIVCLLDPSKIFTPIFIAPKIQSASSTDYISQGAHLHSPLAPLGWHSMQHLVTKSVRAMMNRTAHLRM